MPSYWTVSATFTQLTINSAPLVMMSIIHLDGGWGGGSLIFLPIIGTFKTHAATPGRGRKITTKAASNWEAESVTQARKEGWKMNSKLRKKYLCQHLSLQHDRDVSKSYKKCQNKTGNFKSLGIFFFI